MESGNNGQQPEEQPKEPTIKDLAEKVSLTGKKYEYKLSQLEIRAEIATLKIEKAMCLLRGDQERANQIDDQIKDLEEQYNEP